MKTLVVYFSATGVTAAVAEKVAEAAGADLFEIRPEKPYSGWDLNWMNPTARCSREKLGRRDVPSIGTVEHFEQYDTVLIGFPIWYGCAPNIINTFCKDYDWTGKRVHAFATSGGGGIGRTAAKLEPYVKGAVSVDARLLSSGEEAEAWVRSLG